MNAAPRWAPVIELRQYTMQPGTRDVLIELFEAEFVAAQEATGMTVIGQYRDLDDPSAFVWMRGFPDMHARAGSLSAFYDSPAWLSRRDAANAMLVDNDNVLLLRPALPDARMGLPRRCGLVVATIYHIDPTPEKEVAFMEFFAQSVIPRFVRAGASDIATFVLERSANTFPRLPVRESEHVFVWLARFESVETHDRFEHEMESDTTWRDATGLLLKSKVREPQRLRLVPTEHSRS